MMYYIYNTIEYVNSNERVNTSVTHNVDGSHKHSEWRKHNTKEYILYLSVHLYVILHLAKLLYGVWSQESDDLLGEEWHRSGKGNFWVLEIFYFWIRWWVHGYIQFKRIHQAVHSWCEYITIPILYFQNCLKAYK